MSIPELCVVRSGITPTTSLALVLLAVQRLVSRRYVTNRCALPGTRMYTPRINDGGTALAVQIEDQTFIQYRVVLSPERDQILIMRTINKF